MESAPPPADDHINPQEQDVSPPLESAAELFRNRFDRLLPEIQRRWPELADHTLEATRGSLDEMVQVISRHSGRTANLVQSQLEDLIHALGEGGPEFSGSLEEQLETLLDHLNETLRPRIERPVRQRPLLSLAVAAGVGMILGSILARGRRS